MTDKEYAEAVNKSRKTMQQLKAQAALNDKEYKIKQEQMRASKLAQSKGEIKCRSVILPKAMDSDALSFDFVHLNVQSIRSAERQI